MHAYAVTWIAIVVPLLAADAIDCVPWQIRDLHPQMSVAQVRQALGEPTAVQTVRPHALRTPKETDEDIEVFHYEFEDGSHICVLEEKPHGTLALRYRFPGLDVPSAATMLESRLGRAPAVDSWSSEQCDAVIAVFEEGSATGMTLRSLDTAMRVDEQKVEDAKRSEERRTVPTSIDANGPFLSGVDGVSAPFAFRKTRPAYPPQGRLERVEARVILEVVVQTDGSVSDMTVLQCNRPNLGFEEAAIAAVEEWRFDPALRDGRPVAAYTTLFIEFSLS